MTALPHRLPYRLRVDDLATTSVRVGRAPHVSALGWLIQAAAPAERKHPLASALEHGIPADGRRVFPALGMPGLDRLPDVLVSPVRRASGTVQDYVHDLAEVDAAEFSRDVSTLWDEQPPGPWRAVVDRPRPWLEAACRAMVVAWELCSVHWRSAELLLRREEARVGAAVVTGTLDLLIERIDPRLHVRDGCIEFDADCGRTVDLDGRPLVLVPLLVPGRRPMVGFDEPEAAYIAYPLPGIGTAAPVMPDADRGDRLTVLLGPVRASVLRALDRPLSMQVLASTVHCAPSTLTYHCDQLVAAGLLVRERHGRLMCVSRSDRGERLLDVLA
jgi:hypothetical protein